MTDELERREIERLAAQLDAAVQEAREASRRSEALRKEVAELTAKAEALSRQVDELKQATPPHEPEAE